MEQTIGEIMISEEELQKRIAELGHQISADYKGEDLILIGVLKGACMFMSDLMKRINNTLMIDFMAVSSYGASTESTGVVRIIKDLDISIEGANVIIVEDIIDTGLTLHYLFENLKSRNPKSLKICTLLDKPERRKVELTPDYVGFEVPNKFIVGYGLDYQEIYRNLPYITCLK
ncbi:MAG: hypoxanthine phosphoribosyltransferase [Clostridiales bacterium]|nr:hypoxanthine phosphoribosyltransferase [Clostridiales bacterium]